MNNRVLLGAAMSLLAASVLAQSATYNAKIAFNPPTTNTDGSAISGALTYNVYAGTKGAAKTLLLSAQTASPITIPNAPVGRCYTVTAVSNLGIESAQSNEGCSPFPPNSPGGLTITITISVTP